MTLIVSDVHIEPKDLDTLQSALRPAPFEILYAEVDRSGDSFEYRLLLGPDGEVSIRFQEVQITKRPVANREVR